jgi:hypothetical protein
MVKLNILKVWRISTPDQIRTLNLELLTLDLTDSYLHRKICKVAYSVQLDSGDGRCYKSPAKEVV